MLEFELQHSTLENIYILIPFSVPGGNNTTWRVKHFRFASKDKPYKVWVRVRDSVCLFLAGTELQSNVTKNSN